MIRQDESNVECVYRLKYSIESNRPRVDWEAYDPSEGDDQWGKWKVFEQPFREGIDTLPAPKINFTVVHPEALEWDWYDGPDTWGMWSQRAKDLLWPLANGCLRSFQAMLNGAPYYILRVYDELAIDCLDRERSQLKFFESSGRIMDIKKYAFHMEYLSDPMIFHALDCREILCTQSVRQAILDAGLKGFRIENTKQPKPYMMR